MPANSRQIRQAVELAAFGHYLRTGRRVDVDELTQIVERKFNPYHDPNDGRFTFGPGGGSLSPRSGGSSHLRSGTAQHSSNHATRRSIPSGSSHTGRILLGSAPAPTRNHLPTFEGDPIGKIISKLDQQPASTSHSATRTAPARNIRMAGSKRILENPNVDYGRINSDLGTKINFHRIVKSEGGVYLDSYVPWTENSSPRNNSGVTIAGGLDLGGKNSAYFDGLPQSIVDKMSGAFGKHKATARDWNRVHPIRLTPEEGEILQTFLVKKYAGSAMKYYNDNKDRTSLPFMHLSSAQQTVFYDRYFNAGPRGVGSEFFGHTFRGNWASAAKSLRNAAAANPTWAERLRGAADLIDPRPVKH